MNIDDLGFDGGHQLGDLGQRYLIVYVNAGLQIRQCGRDLVVEFRGRRVLRRGGDILVIRLRRLGGGHGQFKDFVGGGDRGVDDDNRLADCFGDVVGGGRTPQPDGGFQGGDDGLVGHLAFPNRGSLGQGGLGDRRRGRGDGGGGSQGLQRRGQNPLQRRGLSRRQPQSAGRRLKLHLGCQLCHLSGGKVFRIAGGRRGGGSGLDHIDEAQHFGGAAKGNLFRNFFRDFLDIDFRKAGRPGQEQLGFRQLHLEPGLQHLAFLGGLVEGLRDPAQFRDLSKDVPALVLALTFARRYLRLFEGLIDGVAEFARNILVGVGHGLHGGAEPCPEIRHRHGEGRGRRRVGVGNTGRLHGLIEGRNAAARGDGHLADKGRAGILAGLGHHRRGRLTIRVDADAAGRAADTDGRHRRGDGHGVRRRLGDLAADESEGSLQQGNADGPVLLAGVENHLVEGDSTAFTQRERGLVQEHHTHGAVVAGLQDIALEYLIALRESHPGSVGAGRGHLTRGRLHLADGLGSARRAGLSVLAGRQGTGKAQCQLAGDDGSAFGHQVGWNFGLEKTADQNLGSVLADQHEVGTLAQELRAQQPVPATRNDQRLVGTIGN